MSDQPISRTARDTPRYDPSVQRNPKNVFEREPVLIPQLFVDRLPPWYRRRSTIALAGLGTIALGTALFMVTQFGVAGAAQRVGRGGLIVVEGFANLVAR
jgi:hypothetical protein